MPPLIPKIEPGDVIGRCRTVRELGRGGMGTVYLATHQTLQIEVALKVLSPTLSMDNNALAERFIREAQLAARISHPNVIAVMDAAHDEATGLYYIVMEYVGGGSLSWHLRQGPLAETKALGIITGIAHALTIAEENRIVHRDIKPDNIILDRRGVAKLADLGLAKHALDPRLSLTIGGSYMGTPAYMSPDQARDAKIADTRDDIYSLGASFYECLTGEPPFQGETPYNIMSELLTKPSPIPSRLRPDISRCADLICRKMMAKNRDLRYDNARALLDDLEIAQTYGDSGLDRLEAAVLEQDAAALHREEHMYGVETSFDGVYAEPDLPEEPPVVPPYKKKTSTSLMPPRRSGNEVVNAATLLIGLVLATTILLAWAGQSHPLGFLTGKLAQFMGMGQPAPAATPPVKPAKEKEPAHAVKEQPTRSIKPVSSDSHPAPLENRSPDTVPPVSAPSLTVDVPPEQVPIAPPARPDDFSNAGTTDPVIPVSPVPVQSVLSISAFAARDIAEKGLEPRLVAPTGHAELLKIIGKRDEDQATPSAWTFFFYDKSAAGHARIVTVSGGKAVKSGEDLVDFASPYEVESILPEDKIQKDSGDALQIARNLIPGIVVTGSEFVLMQQKNSVPMWKVTLWARDAKGEEHRLGDVILLAENGFLIKKNLTP